MTNNEYGFKVILCTNIFTAPHIYNIINSISVHVTTCYDDDEMMKRSLVLVTASVSGDEVRMTTAMPSSGNEESEEVFCQANSTR